MEKIENYWNLTAALVRISSICINCSLFCRFISPFLQSKKFSENRNLYHENPKDRKYVWLIKLSYIFMMLFLSAIPFEMPGLTAYAAGILVLFGTVYAYDRRNLEQKIFLFFLMYLISWISFELAMIPREVLFRYVLFSDSVTVLTPWVYFGNYVLIEICYILSRYFVMRLLLGIIDRIYLYKYENMSRKELGLMLAIPLSGIIGYVSFSFFSKIYLTDTEWYIQDAHMSYQWVIALYQAMTYAAVVAIIILYQDMKKNHRKEKENAVLAGQVESLKKHIGEVEALYQDIRGLRHDMGNHIMILENLCQKKERQEAIGYLENLKEQFHGAEMEIKSGSPVTDILLTEKRKEAESRKISFQCDFHYPEGVSVNAFDISIILYNALNNAFEGVPECGEPFIRLFSYREKNAYMIEIANSVKEYAILEEESGLPLTTKEKKGEHGCGLINIRRVARKYFGDIAIEQKEGIFVLRVMLMLE